MKIIEAGGAHHQNIVGESGAACVLMFSGGRDSAIAALRLIEAGIPPILVTISSDHLVGIEAVRKRLTEMRNYLPEGTRWLRINQPTDLATDTSFYEQTCLSCHHAYVVVAAAIARSVGAKQLAFGYTGYQNDWPEQTPLATERLRTVLGDYQIELILPVFDLASRSEAETELLAAGLSSLALEQKCSRQVTNVTLPPHKLSAQIALWERAIRRSMDQIDHIPAHIIEDVIVGREHT
jgi:hypothetical protein